MNRFLYTHYKCNWNIIDFLQRKCSAYHELFLNETSCRRTLVANRPQGSGSNIGLFSRINFFSLELSKRECPPIETSLCIWLKLSSSKVKSDWKDCLSMLVIGFPEMESLRSCRSCERDSFGTWVSTFSDKSSVSRTLRPRKASSLTLKIWKFYN